ncbi:SMI1/KNR4 family protein [Adhaeribacter radiodurans]|uniref:SMI1/KNR4 family protein n=1 Tax=Adhaeribacter radiodurans TaxID=2745197 RepID=A0A7L7LEI8_9BACT|nr:SMI1/KNR4 family protein [Adhaeribacter radiodurans]QMU31230.1 SMI1/KNR4 family protein [Adhaeribacter radiodurans]
MDKIINGIVALKKQYPQLIRTFPPVDSRMVKFVEEFLSIKLDEQLLEIYRYSNGLSFLQYALVGINNKQMGNLLDLNQAIPDEMYTLNGNRYLAFMSDAGSGDYSYLDNSQEVYHPVHFYNGESFNHNLIASSVQMFFGFFLERIPYVLENYLKNGEYLSIDDEEIIPPNL